jgi:hypothetical protein
MEGYGALANGMGRGIRACCGQAGPKAVAFCKPHSNSGAFGTSKRPLEEVFNSVGPREDGENRTHDWAKGTPRDLVRLPSLTQGAKPAALAIMACMWHPTGTCMTCVRHLSGICTAFTWHMHDTSTASVRHSHNTYSTFGISIRAIIYSNNNSCTGNWLHRSFNEFEQYEYYSHPLSNIRKTVMNCSFSLVQVPKSHIQAVDK